MEIVINAIRQNISTVTNAHELVLTAMHVSGTGTHEDGLLIGCIPSGIILNNDIKIHAAWWVEIANYGMFDKKTDNSHVSFYLILK